VQVVIARYLHLLGLCVGMAAHVEGQAYAPHSGTTFGAQQIELLAATPAMYEQNAWNFVLWDKEGACDALILHRYVCRFAICRHTKRFRRIW
jgi:hypothetical protein